MIQGSSLSTLQLLEVYIFSSEFGDVPRPSIIMIQNLALNRQQPELTASASQPELTASAS